MLRFFSLFPILSFGLPQKSQDLPYIAVLKEPFDASISDDSITRLSSEIVHGPKSALSSLDYLSLEPDYPLSIAESCVSASESIDSWGLDRIDQRQDMDNKYDYYISSRNITVFILDTGITLLKDFENRATAYEDQLDDHGHGTFVASLIGSTTYGVYKNASLVGIKVLDQNGEGSVSDVIKGLETVLSLQDKNVKSIINISAGSPKSNALNKMVQKALENNIPTVVAAGNDNANACKYSPASSSDAVTVGATTKEDKVSSFSNTGSCVDLFAPGSDITSWSMNQTKTTKSGTSFSSPIVAGTLAQFWALNPDADAKSIIKLLYAQTTKDAVKGLWFWDGAKRDLVYSRQDNLTCSK